MEVNGETVECLEEIPAHVWKSLPDYLNLGPSAVNHSRVGVWATKVIPKGKRFGPFVGEKKKRSQVTSNVYMWEVYFPARGWMCIDATDPMKGNWLRYVNWAQSSGEQNLFPLEINRAIFYKVLRPIRAGEELLVWYTLEDNPEITAALEEERASSLSRRAKRVRRKLLEKARQAGLGGFNKASGTKPTVGGMWKVGEGVKEDDSDISQGVKESCLVDSTACKHGQGVSASVMNRGNWAEVEEEEEEEEDEEDCDDSNGHQTYQQLAVVDQQSGPTLTSDSKSHNSSRAKLKMSSFAQQEQEVDPDGEFEENPQGESFPCHHCERHFSSRQGLERHVHIHGVGGQQAQLFKCRYCNKSFGSQVGRRRHERRHESALTKRPSSLAGSVSLLSPVVQTDSSPDCISPMSHYAAIGSQFTQSSEMQRKEFDRPSVLDDNGESKELHPCKYCNKAFGTHTNMRRHQRRIHERHLLPKGVRRKGMLLQEALGESPSASPPPVYVPSADTEDEADRDDYAIDISKNISENLSFYIDGKIVSTSAVSSCEVIEVDTRSAALFGLDTVIISPNQISQALKVEGRTSAMRQISTSEQPAAKRRTSTPPLVTGLKVETDTTPSSSSSSSSNLLVGGLFQQATDPSTLQREKTVYLSPKLKQLLQTQDFQKSTIALLTESHRLATPLTVASLQGAAGKFKRRTGSPPSSPQLSPACKTESCKAEVASTYTLKVPKLERHSVPPPESLMDKDDWDLLNHAARSQASFSGEEDSCNQQPLDLSNTFGRRSDGLSTAHGDSALDLSFHRKPAVEPESKGNPAQQSLIKRKKPNTSMLEKVLMNEYAGLTLPGEEGPSALANLSCFHSPSPNVASESAHPSPPSLTPIMINPSSPDACIVTSPTPPPPVLPTIPSPPTLTSSPRSQPSDSPPPRPLPVLSPKMSPKSVENKPLFDSNENFSTEDIEDEFEDHVSEPMDAADTPLEGLSDQSLSPSPPAAVESPSKEEDVSLPAACNSPLNKSIKQDTVAETETPLKTDFAALPSQPETPSSSDSPPPALLESPPSLVSQPSPPVKVEEEPPHCEDEFPLVNHAPLAAADSSPQPAAPENPSIKTTEAEEFDSTYCKTFVCNVCEKPFNSIKELSGHIAEHAADWPFKCEFCVQLFSDEAVVLAHRTTLHGVGQIFVCSACSKEFAFLCNLQQHQNDLHPNETCTHTTVESGKLRPQNYTDPARAKTERRPSSLPEETDEGASHGDSEKVKEENDVNGDQVEDPNEELYTTIKIMASEGGKPKGPDVRLGINQHYPSFKPPPFPYHSRSHAGSVASATNFTTHNIPQTFSTAIRCTKCGNGFDNMPELHKHILVCANASDKKRYTPKKNPIPLKQIVKSPNGVASPTAAAVAQNAFRRMGQPKRLNFGQETGKTKMSALSKKKNQLVQKAISQKNKAATTAKKAAVKVEGEQASSVCPHCSREFTYTASLTKHMAISCPMKPVVAKKGKKGLAQVKKESVSVVDKNTSRKKAPDDDVQTEPEVKPLKKTRARSSGAADPESSQTSKGKTSAAVGRLKRPPSFPAPDSARKKPKKGQVQPLPPTPLTPDTPGDAAQRPAMRMQRMGKGPAAKKPAKAKPPQVKKEERLSHRKRGRVGGPVTRSVQMANSAPPAEVKTEEQPVPEPKDSQDLQMK